jgi:hypothetical protein
MLYFSYNDCFLFCLFLLNILTSFSFLHNLFFRKWIYWDEDLYCYPISFRWDLNSHFKAKIEFFNKFSSKGFQTLLHSFHSLDMLILIKVSQFYWVHSYCFTNWKRDHKVKFCSKKEDRSVNRLFQYWFGLYWFTV